MKGLTCRFVLTDGKFTLSGGSERVSDAIWFYCVFNKFRIYLSDFGADFVSLLQKPVGTLIINKTIILTNMRRGIEKYVSGAKVGSIDIGYATNDRTNLSAVIQYSAIIETNQTVQGVTFV